MVGGRRLGGGDNSGLVGDFIRAPRPLRVRVVCLERAVEWVVRLHACAPPRRRQGGSRVLPRGRRVNGSLRRSGRPASVCVSVPCSLWFSSLPCFGVLVVDRLRSVSQTTVPRGTEQAGARLSPGWSASKRCGLCAVTPVLARESSPACGFSTGSVDGQTARPSGEAIGAERRRVENSRRRASAAASTQASYGSGAARLAAVLERDALGRRLLFITCTFRLLAPSVRPPRVGRRCRRTTVPAACSDSGTRSRPRPLGDWTVPKSNSLMTVRPSGNPCSLWVSCGPGCWPPAVRLADVRSA